MSQEVAEKQDLLCQALKAIEIIEQEKTNNEREMKKTVAFLTHKVATLQQAFQRQGTSTEDHCKRQMIELVGRLQDKIQNLKKENETSQSGFLNCSNENFKVRDLCDQTYRLLKILLIRFSKTTSYKILKLLKIKL